MTNTFTQGEHNHALISICGIRYDPNRSQPSLIPFYNTPSSHVHLSNRISQGKFVMREAIIRDSISLVTLRKWNRWHISNKPFHIGKNTLKKHVSHSDIVSLSSTDDLSLFAPVFSHATEKIVIRS